VHRVPSLLEERNESQADSFRSSTKDVMSQDKAPDTEPQDFGDGFASVDRCLFPAMVVVTLLRVCWRGD
ncbi:MAG: hypothetical protein ACTIC1_17930, partial [Brevibacterium sp.]